MPPVRPHHCRVGPLDNHKVGSLRSRGSDALTSSPRSNLASIRLTACLTSTRTTNGPVITAKTKKVMTGKSNAPKSFHANSFASTAPALFIMGTVTLECGFRCAPGTTLGGGLVQSVGQECDDACPNIDCGQHERRRPQNADHHIQHEEVPSGSKSLHGILLGERRDQIDSHPANYPCWLALVAWERAPPSTALAIPRLAATGCHLPSCTSLLTIDL